MREFVLHPTILGVDPGVSTGICLAHYVGGKYRYITSTHTDVKSVWDLIDVPVEVVIIERFHAQVISKYGLHTVDLIGGIKALADRAGIRVIEDTPTQRKPYMTYARFIVPHNPSITRTEQRHEIDATAHVVRYLYNIGHITRLKVDDNG
jgi:hypothetical protein